MRNGTADQPIEILLIEDNPGDVRLTVAIVSAMLEEIDRQALPAQLAKAIERST